MKSNLFRRGGIVLVFVILVFSSQKVSSQTYCTTEDISRYAGEKDGYRYELWNQNGQGTACMTLGEGARFSGEWDSIYNYLARVGLGFDETQTHDEIGTFYSTYDCDYNPTTASGNSYLSIYGWTTNPLKEFYIVEDWRNWIPSMAAGTEKKGTIEVNGGIYDIYESNRVNQPSIIGEATFKQYFSIRRDTRNSGTIDISAHFNKWESLGMEMGNMYEVSFVVEGYQSDGSFEFTELDVFYNEPSAVKDASENNSKLSVFPNPNSGKVFIKLQDSFLNASMKIFDSAGKVVFSKENINNQLEVSNLKSGVYFVNLTNDQQNYFTKFLVL
ncbi:MAG: glycoside hydrolase family 11 protein [Bacteroidales bacterium]|nr:glycoside hydrolase family 11 protein [Bacteroidales bacterium]MBN2817901.1 glycoside hydrolase family 11 protein [Bacteroidales bacterium]